MAVAVSWVVLVFWLFWLFMYASKYIFSQTTIVKLSQNFLIPSNKTEFTEHPTGYSLTVVDPEDKLQDIMSFDPT